MRSQFFKKMKKLNLAVGFLLVIFIASSLAGCGNTKKGQQENILQEASLIEVSIGGMTCLGCEQTIQYNVGKLEGIKSVKASFTQGNAIIEYFPALVDTLKIKEAVIGSGYTVKMFSPVQLQEPAK